MIFWDSSAILPLIVKEASTSAINELFERSLNNVICVLTPVEISSAIFRYVRENLITIDDADNALGRLEDVFDTWSLVDDVYVVMARARRLMRTQSLKAADAMQLAAALIACSDHPEESEFVCLDNRLVLAARQEGFRIVKI